MVHSALAPGVGEAETTMKLRFSRYLLLAWLPILELHRAVFPQTTEVKLLFSAHARLLRHTGDDVDPQLPTPPSRIAVPVGRADCLTRAMKLSVPHFSPVVLLLSDSGTAAAGTAFGMMMMRRPLGSSSSVRFLAKVLAHVLGRRSPHPHDPSRLLGTSPDRFVVVNAPSCVQVAGLTALHCVRKAVVIGIAVLCLAAVLPVVAQSLLFASVVIPLLRERARS